MLYLLGLWIICQKVMFINNFFYTFKTAIEAVDTCFKIFHVFNISYSHVCPHLWCYIQDHIYKIEGKQNIAST